MLYEVITRIDLKQHPLYEEVQVALAKTHYYGGIRKHQWLARELALHGVIALKSGKVIDVTLGEDPSEPVFTIADLLRITSYNVCYTKLLRTLADLHIAGATDADLLRVAEKACAPEESIHNEPVKITPELVREAIKAADAEGRRITSYNVCYTKLLRVPVSRIFIFPARPRAPRQRRGG